MNITINDKEVVIYERSVAELRGFLIAISKMDKPRELLNELLLPNVSFDELAFFSNVSTADLDNFKPSDLMRIADTIKQVNPYWTEFRAKLMALAPKVLADQAKK